MLALKTLKKRMSSIESKISTKDKRDIEILPDYGIHFFNTHKVYRPSKTGVKVHSNPSMVAAVIGPVGSGKSTMMCAHIIHRACAMPRYKTDGVRRSKWIIVRNTYSQLETTTLATWMIWAKNLGKSSLKKAPPMCYISKFNDGFGLVEIEVIFLALDRPEDVEKLDSLEATGAFINEARYAPEKVLTTLQERCGRFPPKTSVDSEFKSCICLDTNPPNVKIGGQYHWFYKRFEIDKPREHVLFKQPSGLIIKDGEYQQNPDAENLENLQENYYVYNTYGKSAEHIKVMLMAHYGIYQDGDPVYEMYNDDLHGIDSADYNPELVVYVGMDFGLTPAAVFCQLTPMGELIIFKEFVTYRMGLEQFIDDLISPYVATNLAGFKLVCVGDPAGRAPSQSKYISCFDVLDEKGFEIIPGPTNDPTIRQDSVKYFLNRMSSGRPAFKLVKDECPILREGFMGGYQTKLSNGRLIAVKNEYSHVHDALQYPSALIRHAPIENKAVKEKFVNNNQLSHAAYGAI